MGSPYSYQDAQAQPKGKKTFSTTFPREIPGMTKDYSVASRAHGFISLASDNVFPYNTPSYIAGD